jgi:Glycosyltransferase family 87
MSKVLRILTIALITMIGVTVLAAISSRVSSNDYIEYWSAGKLFLHGDNPYSSPMTLALEKSHGFIPNDPLIMPNPPWTMLLVAPLGLCSSLVGLVLWILATTGCIVTSIYLIEVPPKYRILAFLFAPVLSTFSMQQSSPFLLLGFSLFLRFHRSRPFLAGASLGLMTIKPHLFLIFWVVLVADCLYRRRSTLLVGLASALVSSSAAVTMVVPHIWRDYFVMIRGAGYGQYLYPTLPVLFRILINPKIVWLALLPSCMAVVWGLVYYWTNRSNWDWKSQGMPVMLITILTSPYGWISDQVVLLPAMASDVSSSRRKFSLEILTCVNLAALFVITISSRLSIWLPVAWLAWYLYAIRPGEHRDSRGDELTNVSRRTSAYSSLARSRILKNVQLGGREHSKVCG